MLVRDPEAFLAAWRQLPADDWGRATARGVMLMAPDGLASDAVTAADNRYMDTGTRIDGDRVQRQHRALAAALAGSVPVWTFPGDPATPDATFLNNAFATAPGRLILGAMRYPERQRETERSDVRGFFRDVLGYRLVELPAEPGVVAELTGSLVIDRRRGVGFCGLGERCTLAGARAMHEAFGLRLTFAFDLAPGEYHTNVVMSVLAGRSLVLCGQGMADPAVPAALRQAYAGECIDLDPAEKNAFAGNCIAVTAGEVWLSAAAATALSPATQAVFTQRDWRLRPVELDEIEKAGGSLRCCVAEVF